MKMCNYYTNKSFKNAQAIYRGTLRAAKEMIENMILSNVN